MKTAPIIIFAYKRTDTMRRVLEGLASNDLAKDSTLYVICDGAKPGADQATLEKIAEARRVAREKQWCGTVKVIERETNFGLGKNIVAGVTEVVERHGRVIVLEDDVMPTPYFLKYMNDALDLYVDNQSVQSIGACNFFALDPDTPETFFIKIPDLLGWATWKDRWSSFEHDGAKLHQQLLEKGMMKEFNLSGVYDFEKILVDQIHGRNTSWAIRWQATAYLKGRLVLYPRRPVVVYLGNDEDATNGILTDLFLVKRVADRPVSVTAIKVEERESVTRQMLQTYTKINMPQPARWKTIIKRWFGRFS